MTLPIGPARRASVRMRGGRGAYRSGAGGAFFHDDHTHLEAAGARRIADVVAKALRDR